jgi:hypothetical protein
MLGRRLSTPLFGANDGLNSTSLDILKPLTAQAFLYTKIVTTLFYTQSSTVSREAAAFRQASRMLEQSGSK